MPSEPQAAQPSVVMTAWEKTSAVRLTAAPSWHPTCKLWWLASVIDKHWCDSPVHVHGMQEPSSRVLHAQHVP